MALVDDREPHPITSRGAIEPAEPLGDRDRDGLLEDLVLREPRLLQRLDLPVGDRVRPVANLLEIAGHLGGRRGAGGGDSS